MVTRDYNYRLYRGVALALGITSLYYTSIISYLLLSLATITLSTIRLSDYQLFMKSLMVNLSLD